MALFNIVAYGAENASHGISQGRYSIENVQTDFVYSDASVGYTYCFNRETGCMIDQMVPKYFIFELNDEFADITVEHFVDSLLESTIKIDGFLSNYLELYAHMETPIKLNNKIILKFPFEHLLVKFFVAETQRSPIHYSLKLSDILINYVCKISMCSELTYVDNDDRRRSLEGYPREHLVQQITSHVVNLSDSSTEFVQMIGFSGITKGYLIEGNVNDLTRFELFLEGHARINYDELMIHLFCQKITDRLMFVPFGLQNSNYKNISTDAYNCGLNQSRINRKKFRLVFKQPQTRVAIHSITINTMRLISGLMGLAYSTMYDTPNTQVNVANNVEQANREYERMHILERNAVNAANATRTKSTNTTGWKRQSKLIDLTRNDICPIELSPFEPDCAYCVCSTCMNNYSYTAMSTWMKIKNTCPTCKTSWTNQIVYINKMDLTTADQN